MRDRVTNPWKQTPTITVIMYRPSDDAVLYRSSTLKIFAAIKLIRPTGA